MTLPYFVPQRGTVGDGALDVPLVQRNDTDSRAGGSPPPERYGFV